MLYREIIEFQMKQMLQFKKEKKSSKKLLNNYSNYLGGTRFELFLFCFAFFLSQPYVQFEQVTLSILVSCFIY